MLCIIIIFIFFGKNSHYIYGYMTLNKAIYLVAIISPLLRVEVKFKYRI